MRRVGPPDRGRGPLIGIAVFSVVIVTGPFLRPLPLYFWAEGLLPLAWLSLGLAILLRPPPPG